LTSDNLPEHIGNLSSKIAFRMDNSVGISTIIQLVNQGLWATSAFIGAEIKGNAFDVINESVKALADEIVQLKNIKNITGEEAVLVELDEEDNLEFLRE
jgi:tRNA A37 threonylcarbamoyladenosine synthetase subunit TsaC/SUA5/YrdC